MERKMERKNQVGHNAGVEGEKAFGLSVCMTGESRGERDVQMKSVDEAERGKKRAGEGF